MIICTLAPEGLAIPFDTVEMDPAMGSPLSPFHTVPNAAHPSLVTVYQLHMIQCDAITVAVAPPVLQDSRTCLVWYLFGPVSLCSSTCNLWCICEVWLLGGTTFTPLWSGTCEVHYLSGLVPPFPQRDIIGAIVIVWRVRGKIVRSVLCNIVCNNCAQCNAHTWTDLTVFWIAFCLTGPILLCLDSFFCMYYFVYHWILHACVGL